MASTNVTMTVVNSQIPEGWSDELILAARFDMVISKLVDLHYRWDKGMGDTLHIRRMVNWEAAPKIHGTDATPTGYTDPGDQIIAINTFEVAISQVESVAQLFLSESYMTEMKNGMGYALNRKVETALANSFQNLSQSPSGSALGTPLGWDSLLNIGILFRQAGVNPDTDNVSLVLSPNQAADFKRVELFTNSLFAGDAGPGRITQASMGKSPILGMSVYESNLLRSASSGHDNAAFDRRCYALVMAQKPKAFEEFRSITMGTVYGWWQAYGIAEINRYGESPGDLTPVDTFGVYAPGS